jgi:hypothetical protein
MRQEAWRSHIAAILLLGLISGTAAAKLPAPTPEQQQAAAAKKAQAAAQQEKEKQQLSESMDKVSERWRDRAAKEGWKTHAPTPIATPAAAPAQGAPTQAAQAAPGQSAAAQPGSATTATPAPTMPPIRSEKFGTAPPSEDVKTNKPAGAKVDERIYKNPVEEPPHKKPAK